MYASWRLCNNINAFNWILLVAFDSSHRLLVLPTSLGSRIRTVWRCGARGAQLTSRADLPMARRDLLPRQAMPSSHTPLLRP